MYYPFKHLCFVKALDLVRKYTNLTDRESVPITIVSAHRKIQYPTITRVEQKELHEPYFISFFPDVLNHCLNFESCVSFWLYIYNNDTMHIIYIAHHLFYPIAQGPKGMNHNRYFSLFYFTIKLRLLIH